MVGSDADGSHGGWRGKRRRPGAGVPPGEGGLTPEGADWLAAGGSNEWLLADGEDGTPPDGEKGPAADGSEDQAAEAAEEPRAPAAAPARRGEPAADGSEDQGAEADEEPGADGIDTDGAPAFEASGVDGENAAPAEASGVDLARGGPDAGEDATPQDADALEQQDEAEHGLPDLLATERSRSSERESRAATGSRARARREDSAVRRARRRRGVLIVGMSLVVAFVVVMLEREPSQPVATPVAATTPGETTELARGGTRVLPNYEVVGYYGAPQAPELGVLGLTPPDEAVNVLNVRAQEYEELSNKPIYPAFELISTLAQNAPGPSGKYRFRQSEGLIDEYLQVANENEFLLILDIQPGHSDFVAEVKRLEPFLRNPNVSIALDPEWNVPPDKVPGEVIGQVDAEVVNDVAKLMSEQVRELGLPQKLLIIHQFTDDMIRNVDKLKKFPGVALVLNSDGFGTTELKSGTYGRLAPSKQPPYPGFKLFFTEDTGLMSAQEVLDLQPRPKVIVYE